VGSIPRGRAPIVQGATLQGVRGGARQADERRGSAGQHRHERERAGAPTSNGLIDFDDVQRTLATAGIELRGGAADEAPAAYKRLDAVLAAHGATIEVLHRLDANRRGDGGR